MEAESSPIIGEIFGHQKAVLSSVWFYKHGGTDPVSFSPIDRNCNLEIALLFQRFCSSNRQKIHSACTHRILETHSRIAQSDDFLLRLRNRWSKDGEKQARFFTKNGWINREKTAMESACFFAPRPLYHNGKKLVNPVLQKVLQDGLSAGQTE